MSINTPDSRPADVQSNADSQIGSPSLVSEECEAPTDLELGILPIITQSQAAFRRDLPRLLEERPGQWVAYHGDEQIGFARTKTELYQDCLRRGFKRDEFLVRSIEPETDPMMVGPRVLG